jgi:hypothetical protein
MFDRIPLFVFHLTIRQGVATNGRVRLLLKLGSKRCAILSLFYNMRNVLTSLPPSLYLPPRVSFRPRRTGERKRKSVRGCIVGSDLSVLNLGMPFHPASLAAHVLAFNPAPSKRRSRLLSPPVVMKKGAAEISGLTDDAKPRRLGPKRATAIRKLFNLKNTGMRLVGALPGIHVAVLFLAVLSCSVLMSVCVQLSFITRARRCDQEG